MADAVAPNPEAPVAEARPAPVAPNPAMPVESSETPEVLLGTLTRDGTPRCEGTELHWEQVHFDAGFTHLKAGAQPLEAKFQQLLRQPVLLTGQAAPEGGAEIAAGVHPCAPAQMRSDWVVRVDGTQSLRSTRDDVGTFVVDSIRALTPAELGAQRRGDRIAVHFRNPLAIPLHELQIAVHYEGCYGKPGTLVEASEASDLAPGEVRELEVDLIALRARSRASSRRVDGAHVARSVEIRASAPRTYFDLEVPLAGLGVDTACPKR